MFLSVNAIRLGYFIFFYEVLTTFFFVPDAFQSTSASENEGIIDVKEDPVEVSLCVFFRNLVLTYYLHSFRSNFVYPRRQDGLSPLFPSGWAKRSVAL